MQVLVADNEPIDDKFPVPAGIRLIPSTDLQGYSLVDELYKKYAHMKWISSAGL
ncbi:MAG: hypothetical protein WDO16_05785 [Bacteroidota bacterium]